MRNINQAQFNVSEPGIPSMVKNLCLEFEVNQKRVLEIGVGWGGFAYEMLTRGAIFTGIEPHVVDLETVNGDLRLRDGEFLLGSALDLPFKDRTFDYIFSWEVLEHIPVGQEETFFSEAFRCLKPGGIMALSTPSQNFLSILFDPAWFLLKHRHYSARQIERFADLSGFELRQNHQLGNLPLAIWNVSTYFSKWILRRKTNILRFELFSSILASDIKKPGFVSRLVVLKRVS